MNKKQKNNLIRIIIAAALLVALYFIELDRPIMLILYLVPYLVIGYDILRKAGKGIVNRQPLDENLLMAIATIGALALAVYRTGDFTEAVAVMLFYQVGELFQSYAVGRSRRNIGELMDIRPDYANIEGPDGIEQVDPDEVEVGTVILVQPGEKIPIDGIVEEGSASLDTSALTGESVPRSVHEGDEVISGCINTNGLLRIRTTHEFDESTASKILDMVENASSRKSRSENFISRFARVYTPVVVICAVALAILPPLIQMLLGLDSGWSVWIYRALTFLVVSCPCALVISIPLSFFAGIGGASREGILIKGSNYLEALSKVRTVVMDKTGTLTKGVFQVVRVVPAGEEAADAEDADAEDAAGMTAKARLLHLAAAAERHSSHPIAQALRAASEAADQALAATGEALVEDVEEIAGHGIRARVDGNLVCVGNRKMMKLAGVGTDLAAEDGGTVVHVAVDGVYAGRIVIADVIKENSAAAISRMKAAGVTRTVMLTGDSKAAAELVGSKLGIRDIRSDLLPADKVSAVEELLQELGAKGSGDDRDAALKDDPRRGRLAFVGDGINDAPVLSRADIGIAMGALGSDAAIEAADVVLMDDDPLKISKAIRISRKCMRIVQENIWFAIGIKVLCLILCAVGIVGMWAAIFADVGVMVLAVLNAMRTLFVKKL
ncbi:MAG: heavy metal translocating P-type ATPase [Firmicutes bacterium]|nr:heavy metal translocating P-type ATPase [Bacillota bacterium]